jgi:hypothetical protein
MAKAVISNKNPIKTVSVKNATYSHVKINDIIPFRVRFTNIGIPSHGSNNVPGIGIQIIGFSNYIL